MRPLLSITFPQGFQISKSVGHPTSGSGGKKTFNWYLKSQQTDRQTDTRTDGHFDIESIGPEGQCFEKFNTFVEMQREVLLSFIQVNQYSYLITFNNLYLWF